MLIYGFPLSLLGFALSYAQLKPVPCKSTQAALDLRESQATDIQKQVIISTTPVLLFPNPVPPATYKAPEQVFVCLERLRLVVPALFRLDGHICSPPPPHACHNALLYSSLASLITFCIYDNGCLQIDLKVTSFILPPFLQTMPQRLAVLPSCCCLVLCLDTVHSKVLSIARTISSI